RFRRAAADRFAGSPRFCSREGRRAILVAADRADPPGLPHRHTVRRLYRRRPRVSRPPYRVRTGRAADPGPGPRARPPLARRLATNRALSAIVCVSEKRLLLVMDFRDYLTLARTLAGGATEAEWRTASSRAYYAAFHVARELLADLGFRVPQADRA